MKGRALPAVVTALTVALLTGCATTTIGEPEPAPTTATPVFASDEEALAAAQKVYDAYLKAMNDIARSDSRNLAAIEDLVTTEQLEREEGERSNLADQGKRLDGAMAFDSFKLQKVDPSGATDVYVCLDLSAARVINQEGEDVTRSDRITKRPLLVHFVWIDDTLRLSGSESWSSGDFC